jgi:hypothetical protein
MQRSKWLDMWNERVDNPPAGAKPVSPASSGRLGSQERILRNGGNAFGRTESEGRARECHRARMNQNRNDQEGAGQRPGPQGAGPFPNLDGPYGGTRRHPTRCRLSFFICGTLCYRSDVSSRRWRGRWLLNLLRVISAGIGEDLQLSIRRHAKTNPHNLSVRKLG